MKIHVIQHESFEGLACIEHWLKLNNFSFGLTRTYDAQPVYPTNEVDFLIIMGGTASVFDEVTYPWLKEEKSFIRKQIDNGAVVLGICLGAQLLADVLGASVYSNQKNEIGWFPVSFYEPMLELFPFIPSLYTVFHWHGDTFDIPPGAIPLGSSEATPNQGFIYNKKIFAFQFHLEVTPTSLTELANGVSDIGTGQYVQSVNEFLYNRNPFRECNQVMYKILDHIKEKYLENLGQNCR